MSSTTCPVFYPTLEEFKNFYSYIQYIERTIDLEQIGLVKIIPPKGLNSFVFLLFLFSLFLFYFSSLNFNN